MRTPNRSSPAFNQSHCRRRGVRPRPCRSTGLRVIPGQSKRRGPGASLDCVARTVSRCIFLTLTEVLP